MSESKEKIQAVVDRLHEVFKEEKEDIKRAWTLLKGGFVVKAFMVVRDTMEAVCLAAQEVGEELGGLSDGELKTAVVRFADDMIPLPVVFEVADGPVLSFAYDFVKARLDKTTLDERGIEAAKKILGHVKDAIALPEPTPEG